jgi:hypothetical protein
MVSVSPMCSRRKGTLGWLSRPANTLPGRITYNGHWPHRALGQAAPLRPLPGPMAEPGRILRVEVHCRDRLGGILHEYLHAV